MQEQPPPCAMDCQSSLQSVKVLEGQIPNIGLNCGGSGVDLSVSRRNYAPGHTGRTGTVTNCKCGELGRYEGSCIEHCDLSKRSSACLLSHTAELANQAYAFGIHVDSDMEYGGAYTDDLDFLEELQKKVERFEKELRSRPNWRN